VRWPSGTRQSLRAEGGSIFENTRSGAIVIHGILFFLLTLQDVSAEGARHMQAGVDAHKQGRFDVAIAEFRKATETDPNLADAFLDLGEELMQTHDYAGAIAPLRRALGAQSES